MIWAFGGPVVFVLVVNTVMFVEALVIAHRSLARKRGGGGGSPEKNSTTSNTLTLLKGTYYLLTSANLDIYCSNYFIKSARPYLFLSSISKKWGESA